MQPIFARGNSRTLQRLKALLQEAQTDSATRVVLRLQAIMLLNMATVLTVQEFVNWGDPSTTSGAELRGMQQAWSLDCTCGIGKV